MANHTIVLITASQLAPSKDIHNITCTHTDTQSFSHRCAHSYELTVSSLAVNQTQIYFVWGTKDPIAKLEHTLLSYLSERAVNTWSQHYEKSHTHAQSHAQSHAQDTGCIIHSPKLGTPVVCSHTINRDEFIRNLPSAENMKNLIIPRNKNS